MTQLWIKWKRLNPVVAVGAAIAASQAVFALYHLPNLVLGVSGRAGTGFSEVATQLALDFAIGIVFAAIYLRTGNLFLVMGIHALQNARTSLVATPVDPSLVIFALAIIVVLATFTPSAWPRLSGVVGATRPANPVGSKTGIVS